MGNDAQLVFNLLLEASNEKPADADAACIDYDPPSRRVLAVLRSISGPFAFLFYDSRAQRIFFGRDILGRRALLTTVRGDGGMQISSVCDDCRPGAWEEVEADGLRVLDIDRTINSKQLADNLSRHHQPPIYKPRYIPWSPRESHASLSNILVLCSYVVI